MIRVLLQYFRPHRRLFAIDMACALAASAVDLSFPLISRHAMYKLLPNRIYELFFFIMLLIALFYLLRAGCYYVMTWLGHTFGVRVETDIRRDLFHHLQDLDFDFYDRNRTGQLMSRLTGDLFEITELAHHGPEDIVISALTILGALVCMFFIEWKLAIVVALLLPLFIIIVMKQRRDMSRTSVNVKQKLAVINTDIESCLSGVRTSKAFANEAVDSLRFNRSNQQYQNAKQDYYKAMGRFFSSQEFCMGIMPVIVIAFGGFLIMEGDLNYIDLITFTLFVSTFITPVRKLSNFAETFTNGLAGLKRFSELMAVEPSVREAANASDLEVRDGSIEFDHVRFSYDGRIDALQDITLSVKAGETVALVGHSGGGKTTVSHLIPRFYDVSNGAICIDGTDIRTVTKRSLRKEIGIVQQDVFIFADTIFENIRYGRPEASVEEVLEAARKAEIYDEIMAMPDQFETYVGERGTHLSGGQKQRVSIARIFLKNPKILILDEATSALDTITEARIQESLDQLSDGRTAIVIAHRLTTVRGADRIILIDHGRILEQGTHEELLAKGGQYARLHKTQQLLA